VGTESTGPDPIPCGVDGDRKLIPGFELPISVGNKKEACQARFIHHSPGSTALRPVKLSLVLILLADLNTEGKYE
jgi:hypothetical protein